MITLLFTPTRKLLQILHRKSLIWGVSGMILFMPFAGIAKVLLEYNESTRPLVALFEIQHEKVPRPSGKLDQDRPEGGQ